MVTSVLEQVSNDFWELNLYIFLQIHYRIGQNFMSLAYYFRNKGFVDPCEQTLISRREKFRWNQTNKTLLLELLVFSIYIINCYPNLMYLLRVPINDF